MSASQPKSVPAKQVRNITDFFNAADITNVRLSIYEQFYLWLDAVHDLPDSTGTRYRSMHSRCFVSKKVNDALYKLELQRQRKALKRSAADAKKAAAMRNLDAGPLSPVDYEVFVVLTDD